MGEASEQIKMKEGKHRNEAPPTPRLGGGGVDLDTIIEETETDEEKQNRLRLEAEQEEKMRETMRRSMRGFAARKAKQREQAVASGAALPSTTME